MNPIESEHLIELESRIAFTERLVDRLNDVLLRQQDQIDALTLELQRVRDSLDSPQDTMPNLEKPPHY